MLQFGDEHRRDAMQYRAALRFDGFQHRQRIEAGRGVNHGDAMDDAHEVAHHHAETMIERHGYAYPITRDRTHCCTAHGCIIEDIAVREGYALGRSGGAAGKLDIDRIARLQRHGDAGKFRF